MYALIKDWPIYTCAVCNVQQAGDRRLTCEGEFSSSAELLIAAEELHKNNPPFAMPIGWASYGNNQFKCPRCST